MGCTCQPELHPHGHKAEGTPKHSPLDLLHLPDRGIEAGQELERILVFQANLEVLKFPECSRRGGAHCGHPPLATPQVPPCSGARNSSCSILEMGVGAPGAKRTWRISCSKIPGHPTAQELFHFAGLQQLWTGHLPLSRCSGRKVNTTFLWGDGNGQEINYFLGKNLQKFQKKTILIHWEVQRRNSWGPHPSCHPHTAINLSLGTPLG